MSKIWNLIKNVWISWHWTTCTEVMVSELQRFNSFVSHWLLVKILQCHYRSSKNYHDPVSNMDYFLELQCSYYDPDYGITTNSMLQKQRMSMLHAHVFLHANVLVQCRQLWPPPSPTLPSCCRLPSLSDTIDNNKSKYMYYVFLKLNVVKLCWKLDWIPVHDLLHTCRYAHMCMYRIKSVLQGNTWLGLFASIFIFVKIL